MRHDTEQFETFLAECRDRCNGALDHHLKRQQALAPRLLAAMEYATLQGGKRLRPALVYASARVGGEAGALSDRAACAVELIHCYSLVHDDLPAMDDDDLRRGRPTTHRAYDEATAILTGDALQSLAFLLLSEQGAPGNAADRIAMLETLARASGAEGMAGGQSLDIDAAASQLTLKQLEAMHRLKTGALIEASVVLGARSNGIQAGPEMDALMRFGACVGLAFQVQDDILDVTGDTGTLGKTGGADAARDKPTYTSLLGVDGAREKALELTREALEALQNFGNEASALRSLAHYITRRVH